MTTLDRDAALKAARSGHLITLVAFLGMAGVYVRAIWFTPVERFQGVAQKIVYLHAPSAWVTFLAFGVCGILSIVYLGLKDMRLDRLAAASAEVGVAFSLILMTTGPIYGKPIWGAWWDWDARLSSTLFLFLLFVGYMVLRDSVIDPEQRARYSAVLGIMGLVLIPFIHLTVYLFRTIHPQPVLMKPSAPSMPPAMLTTFALSAGVFTVLYVGFWIQRYALASLRHLRDEEIVNAS